MTPKEIAARLPELTGGPHDDDTIIALATITAEAIRALNHATLGPAALAEPATAYRVLGELTTAVHRLPQLLSQLTQWLTNEYTGNRLAHDGELPDAVARAVASLDHDAAPHAAGLAAALDRAHQTTAGLYRADEPDEDGDKR